MNTTRSGLARFVLDNSLLLLAGTALAVLWANVDVGSYDRIAHPLHFVVNDIGMVFFFALAAKEIFEKDGKGFYVFESVSRNQHGQEVVRGTWTNIVRGV